ADRRADLKSPRARRIAGAPCLTATRRGLLQKRLRVSVRAARTQPSPTAEHRLSELFQQSPQGSACARRAASAPAAHPTRAPRQTAWRNRPVAAFQAVLWVAVKLDGGSEPLF